MKITTHIFQGSQGETTVEQALDNLEAAVDAELMLRGPGGQRHPTLPGDFKQYIRNPGERFRSTEKFDNFVGKKIFLS